MTDHKYCLYEREWGKQLETIEAIKAAAKEIKNCTVEIKKSVNQLATQAALNRQSLRRLWWFVGPIALVIVSTGLKVWIFSG
jgi:hypothetical protein